MRAVALVALALVACRADDTKDTEPVDSGDTAPEVRDPRFDALAAAIEAERDALGAPGVAVAVFDSQGVLWAEGFGVRHPDEDTPVADTTLFRIGSVTKMLTAAALLQQVEDGLVDLEAPVTDYVPDLAFTRDPTWADSIQVGHLINHTAGLYDYGSLNDGPDDANLSDILTGYFAHNCWLMSPSGRFWNYSNPNFSLAGLIVERVDGRSYREVMDAELFTPLGMDRTFFLGEDVLADGDYASGLTTNWVTGQGRAVAEPDSYDSGFMRPAGFAYASVHDLAAFGGFLLAGDPGVLSDTLRSEMRSAQIPLEMGVPFQSYGYGLFISDGILQADGLVPTPLVSHGGDIPGFAADLYLLPEQDLGIAMLANTDRAHFSNVLDEWMALADLPAPVEAPDLSPDPDTFASVAGRYSDPYNVGDIEVTVDGEQVGISMPLLDQYDIPYGARLTPYLPDTFILQVQGIQVALTFIRDGDGEVEYLRTRYFVGARAEDEAAGPPLSPPVPRLSPAPLGAPLPR
ncbi:MAG: serine hydrolase [Alphaproteobacteria bacterium]|nr:serine hydrolase [Alphaproteobacteria bacterium]